MHVRGMIVVPWLCLKVQPGQALPLRSPVVPRLSLCSHWPPRYCPMYFSLPRPPHGLLASSLPSSSLEVRCSLLNDQDAAQAAITKHHTLGSLNNRNLFSPFQRLGV